MKSLIAAVVFAFMFAAPVDAHWHGYGHHGNVATFAFFPSYPVASFPVAGYPVAGYPVAGYPVAGAVSSCQTAGVVAGSVPTYTVAPLSLPTYAVDNQPVLILRDRFYRHWHNHR